MLKFLDQRPPVCPKALLQRAKSSQTRPRVAVATGSKAPREVVRRLPDTRRVNLPVRPSHTIEVIRIS